jgi:23S rRNA pseudouridine2457 synthase
MLVYASRIKPFWQPSGFSFHLCTPAATKLVGNLFLRQIGTMPVKMDSRKKQPQESDAVFAVNKPYGMLSQFTPDHPGQVTLASLHLPPSVYAVGRLDADSEGLLILASGGALSKLLHSEKKRVWKTYWVQVEAIPAPASLDKLASGVIIQGFRTKPAQVRYIPAPDLPQRIPPIRVRRQIPTCWLEIALQEGKNRQIRRMTAAIGHPTLRLWRNAIGAFHLPACLPVGAWTQLTTKEIERLTNVAG